MLSLKKRIYYTLYTEEVAHINTPMQARQLLFNWVNKKPLTRSSWSTDELIELVSKLKDYASIFTQFSTVEKMKNESPYDKINAKPSVLSDYLIKLFVDCDNPVDKEKFKPLLLSFCTQSARSRWDWTLYALKTGLMEASHKDNAFMSQLVEIEFINNLNDSQTLSSILVIVKAVHDYDIEYGQKNLSNNLLELFLTAFDKSSYAAQALDKVTNTPPNILISAHFTPSVAPKLINLIIKNRGLNYLEACYRALQEHPTFDLNKNVVSLIEKELLNNSISSLPIHIKEAYKV